MFGRHIHPSQFPTPTRALCTSCGALCDFPESPQSICTSCDAPIERESMLRLYEYAAEVHYYGYQYRKLYERAYERAKDPPKLSLAFAGEAFAWVMLAVLSGVLGNAAYDLVKAVIAKIREDIVAGKLPARDYTPILELNDEQLGDLIDAARVYADRMEGLTKEVRVAIVEEIVSDTIAHDAALAAEMNKLMQRRVVKPKHRKRFAELLRRAIGQHRARTEPVAQAFDDFWSRLGK